MDYYYKYLKYKNKYLNILFGGKKNEIKKNEIKKNEILFFNSDEFLVSRNNSIIVPIDRDQMYIEIGNNGSFYLKMSSKYVKEADKLVIQTNLSNLNYKMYDIDIMQFQIGYINYHIKFFINNRYKKFKDLVHILDKYENKKIDILYFPPIDSLPITKEHHFGTLMLFTTSILNKLKAGKKYYLIYNQNWNRDYDGKYSIMIFDYDARKKYSDESDDLPGKICFYDNKTKKFTWNEPYYVHLDVDNFVTGGGDDPVHLVYEWNPLFKVPKIPCAKNALVGKDVFSEK